MLKTDGIVSGVKLASLKHCIPCNLSVVLEMYSENPRYVKICPLIRPSINNEIIKKN